MKKIVPIILGFCMMLLWTVPAFADGRGPAFTSFDVVCTKDTPYYRENWDKNGVMEKKGSFPAGTTLTVEYEYEQDGVLYGSVSIGYDEDREWRYILLSDVAIKDGTYLPENAQKLSRPHTVRVIERGGTPLYAGPNKKFDKIMTIPRGTKLTYTYGNDEDDYYRTWAYVTYLNKSGWIYVYASDTRNGLAELPESDRKAEIWVLEDDVKMYGGMSFGNIEQYFEDWDADELADLHEEPDRETGTLEKGKKYSYRYSHDSDYGSWYYVTAGLRVGWVYMDRKNSQIAVTADEEIQNYFLTYKDAKLKLRETPNKKANGTTVSVARNTMLTSAYVAYEDYDTYYYATIQGRDGWYSRSDSEDVSAEKLETDAIAHGYADRNNSDHDAPIYSDIVSKGKTVGNIPAGSLYTPLYYGSYRTHPEDEDNYDWTSFYFVQYNDVTGWVFSEDLWAPDEEETTEPEETEEYDEWEEDEWEEENWDEDTWDEEDYGDEEYDEPYVAFPSGLTPLQIVLVCVGGAVVLALTATVTLLLTRRRRNGKTEVHAENESSDET